MLYYFINWVLSIKRITFYLSNEIYMQKGLFILNRRMLYTNLVSCLVYYNVSEFNG